jgi:hypothetical protein
MASAPTPSKNAPNRSLRWSAMNPSMLVAV